ncbi:MAG: hypothetical protein D6704_04030 [Nitrospirae bacterium]|nr:MAG: hypothetical protein D6704_04030 [Nitrospirota bacterium]
METLTTVKPSPDSPTPQPFLCRRPVRVAFYTGFVLFGLFMLAWGYLPRLLDPTFEQHIQDHRVVVGMTRAQALEAWGSPYQMNVSYTDRGVRREEWIYEDWIDAGTVKHRYLYFEEGILVGGWSE